MASQMTHDEITSTGDACAHARWDRGQRLTDAEKETLMWNGRFGSDSYPVRKMGRHWSIDHASAASRCFPTKREAVQAWETYIAILLRLSGLAAQERAFNELSERTGRSVQELREEYGQ
jgi:hypothetical protein